MNYLFKLRLLMYRNFFKAKNFLIYCKIQNKKPSYFSELLVITIIILISFYFNRICFNYILNT